MLHCFLKIYNKNSIIKIFRKGVIYMGNGQQGIDEESAYINANYSSSSDSAGSSNSDSSSSSESSNSSSESGDDK